MRLGEVFERVGPVLQCVVSETIARVTFASEADAHKAVDVYNGGVLEMAAQGRHRPVGSVSCS